MASSNTLSSVSVGEDASLEPLLCGWPKDGVDEELGLNARRPSSRVVGSSCVHCFDKSGCPVRFRWESPASVQRSLVLNNVKGASWSRA